MAGGWGTSGADVAFGDGRRDDGGTTDPLAVVALVVALMGLLVPPLLVVGAGLGIAALVRSARRPGWGLAAAAVAFGGTASVVSLAVGLVLATAPFSPWQAQVWFRIDDGAAVAAPATSGGPATTAPPLSEPLRTDDPADTLDDPSPTPSPSTPSTTPSTPADEDRWTVTADQLVPGDCVEELFDRDEVGEVTVISCREPHAYEIFAAFSVEDALWPGDEGIIDAAFVGCGERLDDALARYGVEDDSLDLWVLYPTKDSWDWGDRSVTCAIYDWQDGILDPGHLISGTAVPLSMAEG